MENQFWKHIQTVKNSAPLVQNITNFVVMNNTANALLAVGASPIMSHGHDEINDIGTICQSLVINIGTLDNYWSQAMLKAAELAHHTKKPWILDPVGAGASHYRTTLLTQLLEYRPTVIRGNASEIMALAQVKISRTKGVDSTAVSMEAMEAAKLLHKNYYAVVCVSGEIDIVVGPKTSVFIKNGHALMTKVTGLGCSATAIIGAFIAVIDDKMEAVATAMALFGICGELAAHNCAGPGSLQTQLLDKLYNITASEFNNTLNIELHD
ncbi:hydroxyethylthiazole kinase [Kriegella aquimaris]|uniref:Hydroxyethylthiazole kinase n=1 Tax=Kriegella aquimaris TaxID=192904 RepID=A0A1G9TFM0_9FLAO|nr:hydroxyethylthiazole kinase [Kriegella aquimaris]SDM45945.1 hydroxyethylthiazole kinase [Kriegella aquimaris]